MNNPIPTNQVTISIQDDPHINAANAGGGEFYVTSGLLQKANDEHLAGVMAHEIAHADLGHVTKLQTIGAGTSIATVLLEALGVPGAGLVPLAGDLLVARPYGRDAEYAADRHGAEILQRTGRDGKRIMADTLTWLMQTEGPGAGGFFATHPAPKIESLGFAICNEQANQEVRRHKQGETHGNARTQPKQIHGRLNGGAPAVDGNIIKL